LRAYSPQERGDEPINPDFHFLSELSELSDERRLAAGHCRHRERATTAKTGAELVLERLLG